MKKWLRALLLETTLRVWWILSALSTLSTFFFRSWVGKVRLASAVSAVIGFAWANYRVFQKQERRISALQQEKQSQETRTSQLRVLLEHGSRYAVRLNFTGAVLEFRLMIENVGRRDSTVNKCHVEILELGQTFSGLRPDDGNQYVPSRRGTQYFGRTLSQTGIIRIPAENATDRGSFLVILEGVSQGMFADKGLIGSDGKLRLLHCRLTLIDTHQATATAEFELRES
ncbi:MAG: hypothetical protein WBE86_03085 [Candidatus Acidiferrales bacterium]